MDKSFLISDFWIDKENFIDEMSKRSHAPSDLLLHSFQLNTLGYTVLEGVVDNHLVDLFLKEVEYIQANPSGFFASFGSDVLPLSQIDMQVPLTKLVDLYVKSNTARQILLNSRVQSFLEFVFEDQISLFQSLYFQRGSTQAIHQDAAYVVLDKMPHNFVAIWVALEDIQENSGELVYIEGSHRNLEFLYPQSRIHWIPEEDGHGIHDHHLHFLSTYAKAHPSLVKKFNAKKGDCLVWHSNLAHGGSQNIHDGLTRKSLVGHFCPARTDPLYLKTVKNRYTSNSCGVRYSSLYYDDSENIF